VSLGSRLAGHVGLREPALVLGSLVVAQWTAVAVFVLVVRHNGWLFYQGGDETFFYTSSWAVAHGHIPEASIGYGWSFLLAPLALAFGPSYIAALPAIVLLQTVVLLPLALYCVYAITERIAGRRLGYLAAAIWVAAPFAVIPLWDHSYHVKYVELFLPQWLGLTGLGDFPSMVCLLVAALFCVRALDRADRFDEAFAGIAAGLAIGIKPSNVLFLLGPLAAFAAARRPREALTFAAALLPAVLTLALWKYRGLGHIPLLTRTETAVAAAAGPVAAGTPPADIVVGRYVHLDWSQLRQNYVDLRSQFWGLLAWQSLPLLGLLGAVRRSAAKTLLLAGWFVSFALVKGTSHAANIDSGSLLRLFMPGFPAVIILTALVPLLLPDVGTAIRQRTRSVAAPVWKSSVALAIGVFAVVPLVLTATLPPIRDATVTKYFDENVFVPVTDLSVRVRRARGGETVSWRAPSAPGVRVFYRVFRARPVVQAPDPSLPPGHDGIRCLRSPGGYAGAADCRLEMSVLGVTRSTTFTDRPARGPWVYRVGVVANWRDDPNAGDTMLISRAAATRTT
jgi:hypothetical protein